MSTDDRNRDIASAMIEHSVAFLGTDDRPEMLERRKRLVEVREQIERLGDGTISDAAMIETLWRGVQLWAESARGFRDIASDSLDVAEEMLSEPEARGFGGNQIRATVADLRRRLDRGPTIAEAAAELHTSEPTLKRAVRDLGLGSWPPAPPRAPDD